MGPVSGVVVYLVVWWTVLFAVLPWGMGRPEAADKPGIKKKFLITSLISAIIWLIIAYLMHIKIIDFRQMAQENPLW